MHFNRKNKRKRFYPVGLLSLLFLPLIFWLEVFRSNPTNERLLSCHFSSYSEYHDHFDQHNCLKQRYTEIYLTDNESDNKLTIQYGQDLIKALSDPENARSGVHFQLNERMNFEDVIAILNCCEKEKKIYCFSGNDSWILNPPRVNLYFQLSHFVTSLSNDWVSNESRF